MKNLYIIFLLIIISISITAQDKRYTHDSENGYMWFDFEKRMISKDLKYDFLSSMLQNDKLKKLSGNQSDSLGCDNEINLLQSNNNFIELDKVIAMIDQFYSYEENLIIPIRYAYCYSIKQSVGIKNDELKEYKTKLVEFCK